MIRRSIVEGGKRFGARYPFDRAWITIYLGRIASWGIESGSFAPSARDAP